MISACFILAGFQFIYLSIERDQVSEKIRLAFLNGSAKDLASYFDKNLDLNLDGYKNDYSQVQAAYILKDFFEENPPKSFEYNRQESFKEGFTYLIGKYKSLDDQFKVFIIIQGIKGNHMISSLAIIKQ